MQIPLYTRSDS